MRNFKGRELITRKCLDGGLEVKRAPGRRVPISVSLMTRYGCCGIMPEKMHMSPRSIRLTVGVTCALVNSIVLSAMTRAESFRGGRREVRRVEATERGAFRRDRRARAKRK